MERILGVIEEQDEPHERWSPQNTVQGVAASMRMHTDDAAYTSQWPSVEFPKPERNGSNQYWGDQIHSQLEVSASRVIEDTAIEGICNSREMLAMYSHITAVR